MFNFDSLVGLDINEATNILKVGGIDDIEIILNSKHNDKCDTTLVCAVRISNNKATIFCGEFCLDLNEEK